MSIAAELRRAMDRRAVTRGDLTRSTGACSTLVKKWMDGTSYPDHGTVVALADLLDWPSLVARSVEDRTGTCEACDAPTFVTRGSVRARFCSMRCRRRASDRRANARTADQERKILRRSLAEHREAVAAMCKACEPEGLCRNRVCELRPVSILPFVPLSRVRAA